MRKRVSGYSRSARYAVGAHGHVPGVPVPLLRRKRKKRGPDPDRRENPLRGSRPFVESLKRDSAAIPQKASDPRSSSGPRVFCFCAAATRRILGTHESTLLLSRVRHERCAMTRVNRASSSRNSSPRRKLPPVGIAEVRHGVLATSSMVTVSPRRSSVNVLT